MGTLNTERLREIPGSVEEVRTAFTVKLPQAAETITDIAKQTGSAQFEKDAKKFAEVVEKVGEMVTKTLGDEGDTLGDNGTVMAAYSAGLKVEKAMGGDM